METSEHARLDNLWALGCIVRAHPKSYGSATLSLKLYSFGNDLRKLPHDYNLRFT